MYSDWNLEQDNSIMHRRDQGGKAGGPLPPPPPTRNRNVTKNKNVTKNPIVVSSFVSFSIFRLQQ